MDVYVKLAGTFYLEILSEDGTVHVKSEANVSGGSFIIGHTIYFRK